MVLLRRRAAERPAHCVLRAELTEHGLLLLLQYGRRYRWDGTGGSGGGLRAICNERTPVTTVHAAISHTPWQTSCVWGSADQWVGCCRDPGADAGASKEHARSAWTSANDMKDTSVCRLSLTSFSGQKQSSSFSKPSSSFSSLWTDLTHLIALAVALITTFGMLRLGGTLARAREKRQHTFI